jgi:tetratricopeptide (TPR) repeat protein
MSSKPKATPFFAKKEYEKAIEAYTAAIELDTTNAVLFSNRSIAHLSNGNAEAALKDAEDSLALDPSYFKAILRKSKALYALGRPGHAEQALKDGLAKFPDEHSAEHQVFEAQLKDLRKEDDGDQRWLSGRRAQIALAVQSDHYQLIGTHRMIAELPHNAFRELWGGYPEYFEAEYNPVEHCKIRCSSLNFPLTVLIVAAAQRAPNEKAPQYEELLRLVLERGWCRVDAKDIQGFTALAHATMRNARVNLAKILLEYGANPNSINRMGVSTISSAVGAQEMEAIELLLDHGADPTIVDIDGTDTITYAAQRYPKILALIHKKLNINQENKDAEPEGKCSNPACGKKGAFRRCSACKLALYCDRDCARADWKEHKKVCSQLADSLLRVDYFTPPGRGAKSILKSAVAELMAYSAAGNTITKSEVDERVNTCSDVIELDEKNLVFKVQVPINLPFGYPNYLKLSNKSKSFEVVCDGDVGTGKELAAVVKRRGVLGVKGYFLGFMNKDGELMLMVDKMLPAQPW